MHNIWVAVACPASRAQDRFRVCSGPGSTRWQHRDRFIGYQLPPDYVVVALAGAILAGTAFMLRSLGDVIGDESRLPPASGAKTRRELYGNRRYLQKKPPSNSN
ncbi:hypothetical protein CCYA_CCYA12G3247 [Cyanidiococcus yangmingshanensis]|nr:hypothetical protein CCYA_CCYA12G3247 [Cyanidiococcus yangmingshanensis]